MTAEEVPEYDNDGRSWVARMLANSEREVPPKRSSSYYDGIRAYMEAEIEDAQTLTEWLQRQPERSLRLPEDAILHNGPAIRWCEEAAQLAHRNDIQTRKLRMACIALGGSLALNLATFLVLTMAWGWR